MFKNNAEIKWARNYVKKLPKPNVTNFRIVPIVKPPNSISFSDRRSWEVWQNFLETGPTGNS